MSISEKPSEETKEKLDELAKKSEFLEGVGVELGSVDYYNIWLDYFYKKEYEKAKGTFGLSAFLPDRQAGIHPTAAT